MQCKDICGTVITNSALQACGNLTYTTANILLVRKHWEEMALGDKVEFGAALCFAYREVITKENIIRLLEKIRLDTLCKTFSNFTPGRFDLVLFKQMLFDNSERIIGLLKLAKELIEANLEISLTPDFISISIFGHDFLFKNILELDESDLDVLIRVLKALGRESIQLFSEMRQQIGLVTLLQFINKRCTELGNDFPLAFNQTLTEYQQARKKTHLPRWIPQTTTNTLML